MLKYVRPLIYKNRFIKLIAALLTALLWFTLHYKL